MADEALKEQTVRDEEQTVPLSDFKRIYAEMKKWKEKYRQQLAKEELLREKEEEIGRLMGVVRQLKVRKSLEEAARRQNAVDPEQVTSLLEERVSLDENYEPVVVDESGQIRFTKTGKRMTVEDLVREFLAANPHHKKATLGGGAGSSPNATAAPSPSLIERINSARSFREIERIVEEHRGKV